MGIEVEHVCAMRDGEKLTYENMFYRSRKSSKNGNTVHKLHGWPFQKGPWCNDRLKTKLLDKVSLNCVSYIGIAADEPNRFHNLSDTKKSLLVEAGWNEAYCRQWCEENDLLSPIYTTATRGGCWFCHNQGVNQLRLLRKNYPELWDLMLKWDTDSPVTFHADGHTVHDFDLRFEMEDYGLIQGRFLWSKVKNYQNLKSE